MADIHDYKTGEWIRKATDAESKQYLSGLSESDHVGAVDGEGYGLPGKNIYMVE